MYPKWQPRSDWADHIGLFKVNLEFTISGVTWKMKYVSVCVRNWELET